MATRKNTAPAGARSQSATRVALNGMEEVSAILLTARRALDLNDEAAEERATLTVADRRLMEVHEALERAEKTESVEAPAPAKAAAHPAALKEAIDEQQSRVWRLRSLIECVTVAGEGGRGIDDPDAALDGLVDYADSIHLALDFGVLTERAQELAEEKVRGTRIERDQTAEEDAS